MKTRAQIECFRNLLLSSVDAVKRDPEGFGVKNVELFEILKKVQVSMLDWVLSGESEDESRTR